MNRSRPFLFAAIVACVATATSCSSFNENASPKLTQKVSFEGSVAKSLVEGHRTIRGTLRFKPVKKSEGIPLLFIADSRGRELEAYWPEGIGFPASIVAGRVYTVELLTRIYTEPTYVFNDLLKITDGGRVIVDASVCEVHGSAMQRQMEKGKSALSYPDSFFPRQEKTFPNDGNVYLLCGSERHPLWKCTKCEEAYHRWTRKHGGYEDW